MTALDSVPVDKLVVLLGYPDEDPEKYYACRVTSRPTIGQIFSDDCLDAMLTRRDILPSSTSRDFVVAATAQELVQNVEPTFRVAGVLCAGIVMAVS